jgi:heme/copper-type cytochrome/quinol oxidase subunit 2
MKRVLVSSFWFLVFLAANAASACPVCFGNPASPLTKGTSNGILFLLGVIGLVQIGFVALFVTFWRRARSLRRRRESFHLIEGGAH